MKINISIEPEDINMVNVCPMLGHNPFVLPCDDNECTLIIADTICDYIPRNQLTTVIQHYISKLRHNGGIVLGGTDILSIAHKVTTDLDIDIANKVLYGTMNHIWDSKKGCSSLMEIKNILQQCGLRIIKQRIDDCKFIVEGQRP